MANKVYSKLDTIPTGVASDKITKGCLVLEGGAFRGLYTEGVLDVLMTVLINMAVNVNVARSTVDRRLGGAVLINIIIRLI